MIVPLQIKGFGVKLCDHTSCDVNTCSNVRNNCYFVEESDISDLARQCVNSPIVLDHDNDKVIGYVTSSYHEPGKGLYIEGFIDDFYFLQTVHGSFDKYKQKKKNVEFLQYLKNIYPAFSLSSNGKIFEHVSLVLTPRRKGTNVTYLPLRDIKRELVTREENSNISEHVLGYMTVYLPEPDRKYYLSCSQRSSINPNNVEFLRASREPMEPPIVTDQTMDHQQPAETLPHIAEQTPQTQSQESELNNEPPPNNQDVVNAAPPPSSVQQQQPPIVQYQQTATNETSSPATYPVQPPPTAMQQQQQPVVSEISPEEYQEFLAFKNQINRQQQPPQPPASAPQKRLSEENAPVEDKRLKISDEDPEWKTAINDMMNNQNQTVKVLQGLMGSINGFLSAQQQNNNNQQPQQQSPANQNQQPQQTQIPQQQQSTNRTVQQPPLQQRYVPYTNNQAGKPYSAVPSFLNASRNVLDDKIMRGGGSQTQSRYRNDLYGSFENDLLRQPKQMLGGHSERNMIQASREPQRDNIDEKTFYSMVANDILNRLSVFSKK